MSNVNYDRGRVKSHFMGVLFSNKELVSLLTGKSIDEDGFTSYQECRELFADHVKSHLFIDDTLTERGSYIFFDAEVPEIRANTKVCRVVCFAVCSRDILDDKVKGHPGNRADALAELVEAATQAPDNVKDFGIGNIDLDSVRIYNSNNYYGSTMIFTIKDFR